MKKLFYITVTVLLTAGFSGCTKDDDNDIDNQPCVITFEDVPADYLAGPAPYGDNLYSNYTGSTPARYTGYTDAGSELFMAINEISGARDFSNGGIAISRWNDTTTASYLNQCSVYYEDPNTHYGGYGGSKTFAVATGYDTEYSACSRIEVKGAAGECVFDHFYVTNTTYAALTMKNGNTFAKQFGSGDWFKLLIEGFDKSGTSTGTVEFYLADFREASSPGIITAWTKVDLSPLGRVAEIKFDMRSSDTGEWGMNTPAYFCFDNLAVRK
jgi:hypothetical protein